MPAHRDKTQKITFVYSNLYSIYRKGVERAREGAVEAPPAGSGPAAPADVFRTQTSGRGSVIKAGDALASQARPLAQPPAPPRAQAYTPAELIGKRVARPAYLAAPAAREVPPAPVAAELSPVESLKQNLQALNDLQARLRFMLQELEELIK